MNNILQKIAAYKREEVTEAKAHRSEAELLSEASNLPDTRGFSKALFLEASQGRMGLIAEIKKASPSKGIIREDFQPDDLAKAYYSGGATCLSVLTDQPSFQGHPDYLAQARNAVPLPLLRKDFMLDSYQVVEARLWGADAILLILAMIDDALARELVSVAQDLSLDVLIEVHDEAERDRAMALEGMIGINNRDLRTFTTDLTTTERLAKPIPADRLIVAESGIFTPEDVASMASAGARAILVGESLMRCLDVAAATQTLLADNKRKAP